MLVSCVCVCVCVLCVWMLVECTCLATHILTIVQVHCGQNQFCGCQFSSKVLELTVKGRRGGVIGHVLCSFP